jgi:hypothetical protein
MKGKKTGGRDWQAGQSGNPNGRVKFPPDVKKARTLNLVEATRALNKYIYMTREELLEAANSPETVALDLMIIRVIVESGKTGDHHRLGFLFDRLIGKVTEKAEVKMPVPTRIKMLDQDASEVLGAAMPEEDES